MWKTKAINRELPPGAGKQRRQRREEGMAMLFLLPSLLGLVLLSLIPMLISLYISLTDWVYTDGLGNWNFVGFQNFIDLWKDSWFQKSLWNTVIFTIVTVPLTIILALVIAALIDNFCADRTAGVVRIALYMPHICNIVATSTIWKTMYSTLPIQIVPERPGLWNMTRHLSGILLMSPLPDMISAMSTLC